MFIVLNIALDMNAAFLTRFYRKLPIAFISLMLSLSVLFEYFSSRNDGSRFAGLWLGGEMNGLFVCEEVQIVWPRDIFRCTSLTSRAAQFTRIEAKCTRTRETAWGS